MAKPWEPEIRDLLAEEIAKAYGLSPGPATLYRWLLEPKNAFFSSWSNFARTFGVDPKTVYIWRKKLLKSGLVPGGGNEIKAK